MNNWTRRLRIRHLTTLMVLFETRNISEAAAQVSMTQPALSKWLRELEIELDVPLFVRHSRGIVPTAYCEVLVGRSRLMLNELDRTAELLKVMADGRSGKLHIGTTPISVTDMLPSAILHFRQTYPNASINIIDNFLDQLLPQLKDGRLDFIISRLEELNYGGDLAQERLYKEQIAVIGGRGHPLAAKRKVNWKEALAYPWIGPPIGSPLHRELEHELALANQPMPPIMIETSSVVLLASILERTDMLAVMSATPARYFQASGQLRLLPLPIQRHNYVGVLWRKNSVAGELQDGFLRSLKTAAGAINQS